MSTITLRNLRTSGLSHRIQSQNTFFALEATRRNGFICLSASSNSSISLQHTLNKSLRHASTSTKRGNPPANNLPPHNASKSNSAATPRQQTTTAQTPPKSYAPSSPPPRTGASTPQTLSKVNGPSTTLPAPISLPPRDPSTSTIKHLYTIGKTYLTFYKTGVKNIYANYKLSRTLQARINKEHDSSLSAAAAAGAVSRSDFQLLIRNWHDVKRVPVFALVFMICGEFTPLVVIALSGVVPWMCRIPRQIENDRKKLEARRKISFRNLTLEPPTEKGVEQLQRMQLLHVSWSLGLSSSVWDWLGGRLPGLPTGILRRRVRDRVGYLEIDDGLIGRWGGVGEMEVEEVRMALVERGVDVLGKKDQDLRADLTSWLKSRDKVPVERLLLTRPSVWPVRPNTK